MPVVDPAGCWRWCHQEQHSALWTDSLVGSTPQSLLRASATTAATTTTATTTTAAANVYSILLVCGLRAGGNRLVQWDILPGGASGVFLVASAERTAESPASRIGVC